MKKYLLCASLVFLLTGCALLENDPDPLDFSEFEVPTFNSASVHDPSVIRVGDWWYVFGSHLSVARTNDFMHWEQVAAYADGYHPMFGYAQEKFRETLEWAETDTFWAPDMIQLQDERFLFFYNACRGDSPRSAMGIAAADDLYGPFEDLGIILKSGMWGEPSPDGRTYNPTHHPNVVDPHVFFDSEGRLWMMYGSFSGGIFIMELDPVTGFPFEGQGYGERMLGGHHLRIEAPYVIHSPTTGYYYMFLTFGGLGRNEGYNMRIMRAERPDGPFFDPMGQDMRTVTGDPGSFFDDVRASRYGGMLMRNHEFVPVEGEPGLRVARHGYMSPGHNSVYRCAETGRYFLIFHTRFRTMGERHQIRVHEMWLNEAGWFVVAPHQYSGQELLDYSISDLVGDFKLIRHEREISAEISRSEIITLNRNGTITGYVDGTWEFQEDTRFINIVIDDVLYQGVVSHQWNEDAHRFVMTFTAMSNETGLAIWGSAVAE